MKQRYFKHGAVLMLGTSFGTMGGVSAVTRLLSESRLFANWRVVYVSTHRDGSRLAKLQLALSAWFRSAWLLITGDIRLVHIHISSYASFWRKSCFMLLARAARTPVVVHMHGADFVEFNQGLPAVGKRFVRWMFANSTLLIALSDEWERRLRVLGGHNRIAVVPNPVVIPPERGARFRKRSTLLFLGNIGHRKGCYVLLDALAVVKEKYPRVRLLCGGDGDHQAFLDAAAKRGLSQNIQLLGWVVGGAKRRLLARSTVFVLPSYSEGLPMALLEAMAAGLPVISTPVGGIPDAVRNGVDGLLVPAGDAPALAQAIERLLSDASLCASLGASARARAIAHFGIEQVVNQIEAIYCDLIDGSLSHHRTSPVL